MDTIMYLSRYDNKFSEICKTGWGCGYVCIPEDHPCIENYRNRLLNEQLAIGEDGYIDKYFYLPEFTQKITYTEWEKINGNNYLVIGFDTAHFYNSPEENTFEWVLNETAKMKNIIDNYNK